PAGQGSYAHWYIGDYDGDGRADLGRYVAGTGSQVLLSTGTGFQAPQTWTAELTGVTGLKILDANGDGLDDLLLLSSTANQSQLLLSTGSSFQAADWTKIGVTGVSTLVGDYNGDSRDDVFNFADTSARAQVYLTETPNTVLTGTAGSVDNFHFSGGDDTILNFDAGGTINDVVSIPTTLAPTYDYIVNHAEQVGLDVGLTFTDGSHLTFNHLLLSQLSSSNFHLT
ncbi:FG-GAP-like repeat-containing protein, partial [Bradyrhizobium sp. I1.7.5]|uniref:FG-GAP-like repeat-containing protein n=1 Tax=Bradyrhizobium sp. I1.7.5 TaxID=3156363 RepID=UPI00339B02CF